MSDQIKVTVVRYGDRRFLTMRYTDPVTGKQQARSTGTTNHREAERRAAKWEAELREGRYQAASRITWADFRERYEEQKLSSLAKRTQFAAATAMNHFERVIGPKKLLSVTSATLSQFQAVLRQEGMKDTTTKAYLAHLRPAFNWAVTMKMLAQAPEIHMPRRARGNKLMRGRPITTEEFERMLETAPNVREYDFAVWQHYQTGLWLSGLRLEESTILSWDDDAPLAVDLSGRRPRFRIYAEAEKGHQDRLLPMTPDFARFLLETSPDERAGRVFKLNGRRTNRPIGARRVGRVISAIGRKAKVVVNKLEGKFASAQDLRRSFGTRWATKVMPATLQLLMRHEAIETTMKYYVDLDADKMADDLWKEFDVDPNSDPEEPCLGDKKC